MHKLNTYTQATLKVNFSSGKSNFKTYLDIFCYKFGNACSILAFFMDFS